MHAKLTALVSQFRFLTLGFFSFTRNLKEQSTPKACTRLRVFIGGVCDQGFALLDTVIQQPIDRGICGLYIIHYSNCYFIEYLTLTPASSFSFADQTHEVIDLSHETAQWYHGDLLRDEAKTLLAHHGACDG